MSQKTLSAFGETDDFLGVRTHPRVPAESEILTLAQNENQERSSAPRRRQIEAQQKLPRVLEPLVRTVLSHASNGSQTPKGWW
jgi:hypothetical protein